MALENLEPENRIERLLSGEDLEAANRLEYFLKQAGSGGNVLPDGEAGEVGFYLSLDNSLRPIWKQSVAVFNTTVSGSVYTFDSTWQVVKNRFMAGLAYVQIGNDICAILAVTEDTEGNQYNIRVAMGGAGIVDYNTNNPLGYPTVDLD